MIFGILGPSSWDVLSVVQKSASTKLFWVKNDPFLTHFGPVFGGCGHFLGRFFVIFWRFWKSRKDSGLNFSKLKKRPKKSPLENAILDPFWTPFFMNLTPWDLISWTRPALKCQLLKSCRKTRKCHFWPFLDPFFVVRFHVFWPPLTNASTCFFDQNGHFGSKSSFLGSKNAIYSSAT